MRRTLIVAAISLLAIPASALAADTTHGTAEADTLAGTPAADAIFARAGDDIVTAGAGDDWVHGGQGADQVSGEDGNDRLKGGAGDDALDGGAGDDVISGRGDGRATDTITCGDGNDTVRASRNDTVAPDCETVSQPGANGKGQADEKPAKAPRAVAAEVQTPAQLAKATCKDQKHAMGTRTFKQTYAAKSTARAMEGCVAKLQPTVAVEAKNAAHECKAERAADAAAFAEKYGTNTNKKNAYGKCVSSKTEEATEEVTEARVNAAKTCKTMRTDDKAAFDAEYGTRKNAFGKCVSATARADEDA